MKADAILDYKMVDDDFMLAPVVPHYLLEHADGRARAVDFLARKTASGMRDGDILARNLAFVAERARPFAQQPGYERLIAFQYGLTVGNWRDSLNGIGGDGVYAYDINATLVPAALDAAARLQASGLLKGYRVQGLCDVAGLPQNMVNRSA